MSEADRVNAPQMDAQPEEACQDEKNEEGGDEISSQEAAEIQKVFDQEDSEENNIEEEENVKGCQPP